MLTTIVGNYPKVPPLGGGPNLRTAISRHDQNRISDEELAQVEDEATADAIGEQVRAGLDMVTDGHLRWEDEITYFTRALSGVTLNGLIRFFDTNTYYRQPIVEGPMAWKKAVTVRDYQAAVARSPRPVKAVLPGPFTIAYHVQNRHYHDLTELCQAAAEALNAEALALQQAGPPSFSSTSPVSSRPRSNFPYSNRPPGH